MFLLFFTYSLDDVIMLFGMINTVFRYQRSSFDIFSKIVTFLQNQFTKKLICDLISELIFKFFFNKSKGISRQF